MLVTDALDSQSFAVFNSWILVLFRINIDNNTLQKHTIRTELVKTRTSLLDNEGKLREKVYV